MDRDGAGLPRPARGRRLHLAAPGQAEPPPRDRVRRSRLGNTPAICRKSYVHPAVIDAYLEGTLLDTLKRRTERELTESMAELRPEEAAVMGLLQQRLVRQQEKKAA